jgi:hypothetical protein
MKSNELKCGKSAYVLMYLSFAALVLAAIVSLLQLELWLAGTQWMLIAIALAIYALILKGCNCQCGDGCSNSNSDEDRSLE